MVGDALLQPVPVVEEDDSVGLAHEIVTHARCPMVAVRMRNGFGLVASSTLQEAAERAEDRVGSLWLVKALQLARDLTAAVALQTLHLGGASVGVVRISDGLVGVVTTDELRLML